MGVTLKDIAKIAGVSESTVSRCLNDSSLVSIKTKEKVQRIAKELDFQFNINARNLAKKETKKIGIIFPNDYYMFNKRHFFSQLQEALFEELENSGYQGVIYTIIKKTSGESNLKKLINNKEVDGVIIACRHTPLDDLDKINSSKIPHVFLYYKPNSDIDESKVFTVDNNYSGYIATKYLLNNGCKKVITITNKNFDLKDYPERTKGFLEAVEEESEIKDSKVLCGETTFEYGESLASDNLEMFKDVDGVFCQQDKVALGLIKGLKEKGIRIPEDISIIGYDDMEITRFFEPKLTTMKQPLGIISRNSVKKLIGDIEGTQKNLKRVFNAEVIEGETVSKK